MTTGINQNIDLFGRTFHVQTELTDGPDYVIRTVVFVDGKIVATRALALKLKEPVPDRDQAIASQITAQHESIISNLYERAKKFKNRKQKELQKPTRSPSQGELTPEQSHKLLEVPTSQPKLNAELRKTIQIRAIYSSFRKELDALTPLNGKNIDQRLSAAHETINAMTRSEIFSHIRVDEQMRFHLLQGQIKDWLNHQENQALGERIWEEIDAFVHYLETVNLRSDLTQYDRDLLLWAIFRLENEAPIGDLVGAMQPIFGRDAKLDCLISGPSLPSRKALLAQASTTLREIMTDITL